MEQPRPGDQVGPYKIEALLGEGGMGSVFRARHLELERPVALKVLRSNLSDSDHVRRFLREIRTHGRLQHPNLVRFLDSGDERGVAYLVMELLDGSTVGQMMAGRGLPVQRSVEIVCDLLSALEHVHKAGMTHRDIKNSNVMVTGEGVTKLMDFGLVHDSGATLITAVGSIVGTPRYLSPEVAAGGTATARSDVYQVGLLLQELLTGRVIMQSESAQKVMQAVMRGGVPLFHSESPNVPEALVSAIDRLRAANPVDRPASALQAQELLLETLRRLSIQSSGDAHKSHGVPVQRRSNSDVTVNLGPRTTGGIRPSVEPTLAMDRGAERASSRARVSSVAFVSFLVATSLWWSTKTAPFPVTSRPPSPSTSAPGSSLPVRDRTWEEWLREATVRAGVQDVDLPVDTWALPDHEGSIPTSPQGGNLVEAFDWALHKGQGVPSITLWWPESGPGLLRACAGRGRGADVRGWLDGKLRRNPTTFWPAVAWAVSGQNDLEPLARAAATVLMQGRWDSGAEESLVVYSVALSLAQREWTRPGLTPDQRRNWAWTVGLLGQVLDLVHSRVARQKSRRSIGLQGRLARVESSLALGLWEQAPRQLKRLGLFLDPLKTQGWAAPWVQRSEAARSLLATRPSSRARVDPAMDAPPLPAPLLAVLPAARGLAARGPTAPGTAVTEAGRVMEALEVVTPELLKHGRDLSWAEADGGVPVWRLVDPTWESLAGPLVELTAGTAVMQRMQRWLVTMEPLGTRSPWYWRRRSHTGRRLGQMGEWALGAAAAVLTSSDRSTSIAQSIDNATMVAQASTDLMEALSLRARIPGPVVGPPWLTRGDWACTLGLSMGGWMLCDAMMDATRDGAATMGCVHLHSARLMLRLGLRSWARRSVDKAVTELLDTRDPLLVPYQKEAVRLQSDRQLSQ